MSQEQIHQNHEQSEAFFQMLKQLQDKDQMNYSSREASQIIGDIDSAIVHANSPVIRQALEKAGLSSEEAISLLKASKNHINQLIAAGTSRPKWDTNESSSSLLNQAMVDPINFSPNQSIDKQFDSVIDAVSKSHTHPDGSRHLAAYGQAVSDIFSNSSESPEQLISWLEDAKQTAKLDGHNRMAAGIETVISFLRTSS